MGDFQTDSVEEMVIRPQAGPQEQFLSSSADIVFYGGAAGGGKTYALLMEPLRHIGVGGFDGVVFRRTYPEVKNPGGLWDTAQDVYPFVGGFPRESNLDWTWGAGPKQALIKFAHLQHEKDKLSWQGAQLAFIGFDEITHFTRSQFFYMLSRNRSVCGVRPYVRATCNPDPDCWVREFITWWIDQDSGLPIAERSGVVRFFARQAGEVIWADDPSELTDLGLEPKSFTFIAASVYDNPALLKADPGYVANLKALPLHEQQQLLDGNWNARPFAGSYFQRQWFEIVDAAPAEARRIRFWDRAATEPSEANPDPDYTVGLKLAEHRGTYYIEHVIRGRMTPAKVESAIVNAAAQDEGTTVGLSEDPGQAGKSEAQYLVRQLRGFQVKLLRETKSKQVRAKPVSSQAQGSNIKVVRGPWNKALFDELEAFPLEGHDDQVDALSGGFALLTSQKRPGVRFI